MAYASIVPLFNTIVVLLSIPQLMLCVVAAAFAVIFPPFIVILSAKIPLAPSAA